MNQRYQKYQYPFATGREPRELPYFGMRKTLTESSRTRFRYRISLRFPISLNASHAWHQRNNFHGHKIWAGTSSSAKYKSNYISIIAKEAAQYFFYTRRKLCSMQRSYPSGYFLTEGRQVKSPLTFLPLGVLAAKHDFLAAVGGATSFTFLDMMKGIFQQSIRKEDRWKTAFATTYRGQE